MPFDMPVQRENITIFHSRNQNVEHRLKFALKALLRHFSCLICLFTGFFAILHSWFNAFAEMLKFADRMFYKVFIKTCK